MRVGCITNTIDALHDGIHSGVVADSGIGTVKVVVNGSWQADTGEVELHTEVASTCQRTVSTNNNQCIYLFLHTSLVSFLHTLGCHKLLRACSLQYRTSAGHDTTYVLCGEGLNLVVNQPLVTTIYTFDCKSVVDTGTCHGTYCGIHTWCIASRRQDTNRLNLSHITFSLLLLLVI